MPEATPLNAVVHGAVTRQGYTVEKVYFESLPGHFVTGSLYRPTGRQGRLPAVLLPHGHWEQGRYMETPDKEFKHELVTGAERFDPGGRHPLQAAPAQLAKMGVIAFLFDLEGYADSVQIPSAVAHGSKGRPKDSPAAPGLFFHAQTDSRLQSIMGLQSWNARRALDFLISLPDVDPVADWRQRRERRRHADIHPRRDRPAARRPLPDGDGRHANAGRLHVRERRLPPDRHRQCRDRLADGAASRGHDDGRRLDEDDAGDRLWRDAGDVEDAGRRG